MKITKAIISSTIFIVSLSSCAISNEGKVDLRRTDINQEIEIINPTPHVTYELSNEVIEQLRKEFKYKPKLETKNYYTKNGFIATVESLVNTKLTESQKSKLIELAKVLRPRVEKYQQLEYKNFSLGTGYNTRFQEGDSISLHLRSAYIKTFTEEKISDFFTNMFSRQRFKTIGEVAIVANAFEELEDRELSFENIRDGRVVFYSNNVHEGQFLNFNNMPIYGPLEYHNAPFAFRISIFELDVVSKQAKAMLSTIAQAGAKAYPPASPVLEVLNGLGNTFLDQDQTDTDFRYAMILDPQGGSPAINHFTLEVGNYVFIRSEDRKEKIEWDNLVLNENTGELFVKEDTEGKPLVPYIKDSYLVVEINKNVSHIGIELAQNNFSDLIDALKDTDESKALSWKSTDNAIKKVSIKRQQLINFYRAKAIVSELNEVDITKKEPINILKTDANELLLMIATSLGDDGNIVPINETTLAGNSQFSLSDKQIKYILRELSRVVSVSSDLHLLSKSNIYSAYINETTTDKKNAIINILVSSKSGQ
jgi:hypothetical protein